MIRESEPSPSYVTFSDTKRSTGDATKSPVAANPTNTAFVAKHVIGHRFDDAGVQSDMKLWPCMVGNDAGRPKVQAKYKGETKMFLSRAGVLFGFDKDEGNCRDLPWEDCYQCLCHSTYLL